VFSNYCSIFGPSAKPMQELIVAEKKKRTRKVVWFIGIDVSKHTLDYAVIYQGELLFHDKRENSKEAIGEFIKELKAQPKFSMAAAIFCMEAMGMYGNHLYSTVNKLKGKITAVNPLIIKNFIGLARGKDDKTDAIRIAFYAQKNTGDLIFRVNERPVLTELRLMFTLRERLLTTAVALRNPLKELEGYAEPKLQKQTLVYTGKSINAIEQSLEEINLVIDRILNNDEELSRLFAIMCSVTGVGRVTALLILITTNEFRDIQCPKKFACYAGVAPFRNESGLMTRRRRVSHLANKKMKSLLHMCALNAIRVDNEITRYFNRKLMEGKPKLLVINAIRYKLICRIFTCIRQNRLFVKHSAGTDITTAASDFMQSNKA